jgi:hypothetical protein
MPAPSGWNLPAFPPAPPQAQAQVQVQGQLPGSAPFYGGLGVGPAPGAGQGQAGMGSGVRRSASDRVRSLSSVHTPPKLRERAASGDFGSPSPLGGIDANANGNGNGNGNANGNGNGNGTRARTISAGARVQSTPEPPAPAPLPATAILGPPPIPPLPVSGTSPSASPLPGRPHHGPPASKVLRGHRRARRGSLSSIDSASEDEREREKENSLSAPGTEGEANGKGRGRLGGFIPTPPKGGSPLAKYNLESDLPPLDPSSHPPPTTPLSAATFGRDDRTPSPPGDIIFPTRVVQSLPQIQAPPQNHAQTESPEQIEIGLPASRGGENGREPALPPGLTFPPPPPTSPPAHLVRPAPMSVSETGELEKDESAAIGIALPGPGETAIDRHPKFPDRASENAIPGAQTIGESDEESTSRSRSPILGSTMNKGRDLRYARQGKSLDQERYLDEDEDGPADAHGHVDIQRRARSASPTRRQSGIPIPPIPPSSKSERRQSASHSSPHLASPSQPLTFANLPSGSKLTRHGSERSRADSNGEGSQGSPKRKINKLQRRRTVDEKKGGLFGRLMGDFGWRKS